MSAIDLDAFDQRARIDGFDELLDRRWDPGTEVPLHTHPFALRAVVVQGELWLTVGDRTRHLGVGDAFALDREVPHAERYGPEGATYRVARRTSAA
jgi:hypothetical protein